MEAELKRLAALVKPKATLYAVGGCVRDGLLGVRAGDVDICSSLRADEMKALLLGSEFKVVDKALRMGTLIIRGRKSSYEYTAFRTDSYDRRGGAHAPSEVRFTTSVFEDAKRRDFTCNAIYFDVLEGSIVDPLGGAEDVQRRVLRTADDPAVTFGADGLRILRLVRFCATLGFEAENKTYEAAKLNTGLINDISKERIKAEMDGILTADEKDKAVKPHSVAMGIEMLCDLNIDRLLFGEYERKDISVRTAALIIERMPRKFRWAGLMWYLVGGDLLKVAKRTADKLRFSSVEKATALGLLKARLDFEDASDLKVFAQRRFEYAQVVADMLDFEKEIGLSSRGGDALREGISAAERLPKMLTDLPVNGRDLIDMNVPERERTPLLRALLDATALDESLLERENALAYIRSHARPDETSGNDE